MAAIVIEAPGELGGPCADGCEHQACVWQRETLGQPCTLCEEPILPGRRFCLEGTEPGEQVFVHELCLIEEADREDRR